MSEMVDPHPEFVSPLDEVSEDDYKTALDELSTIKASPVQTLNRIVRLEAPAYPSISSGPSYSALTERYGEILDKSDIPEDHRYAYLAGLAHGVLAVGRAVQIRQDRIGVMEAVLARVDDEETLSDPALQASLDEMERGELTDVTPEDEGPQETP